MNEAPFTTRRYRPDEPPPFSAQPAAGNEPQVHPLADTFPPMPEADFKTLVANINERGLIEPITLTHDGRIIDGRARYNACSEAGVEPKFTRLREMSADELLGLVISKNRYRRHMTPAQLAWAAFRLVETSHGGARRDPDRPQITTFAEAARCMGINADQIKTASAIQKKALPEIIAAIEDGRIKTMGYAYEVTTPTKDEERDGLTSKDKQRAWLNDPRNIQRPKPRPARQFPQVSITAAQLRALTDEQAVVVMDKLAPKANRALKPEGEQWQKVPLNQRR